MVQMNDSQQRWVGVVTRGGDFSHPGNTSKFGDIFGCNNWGAGHCRLLIGRDQGATKPPTVHKTSSPYTQSTKNYPAP